MKSYTFSHSSVSFQDDGLFIYSLRDKNLVQGTFELKNPWMSTSLLLAMCLSALYVKKVVDKTVTSYNAQSVQCDLYKLWYNFPSVNMTKAL